VHIEGDATNLSVLLSLINRLAHIKDTPVWSQRPCSRGRDDTGSFGCLERKRCTFRYINVRVKCRRKVKSMCRRSDILDDNYNTCCVGEISKTLAMSINA